MEKKIAKRKLISYLLKEYDVDNNLLASYSFPTNIWTINGDWIGKCFSSIERNENGYKCILFAVYDDNSMPVIERRG
jgi:hypothetical protein